MKHAWQLLILAVLLLVSDAAHAQRQMERLGRGVVAVRKSSTSVYIGWRLFGTDPSDIGFNLYRSANGGTSTKLNSGPLTNTTDYVDSTATLTLPNAYYVKPVIGGVEQAASAAFTLPANASVRQYLSIPEHPVGDGTYGIYMGEVGDVDGDGEFELVCIRQHVGTDTNLHTLKLDCYKFNGAFLWEADLGPNITRLYNGQGMLAVADFDGDGKAEVVVKAGEGMIFGDGAYIGDTNGDGKTNYLNSSGDVISGPEFLCVLDGATGKELARTAYQPSMGTDPYAKWGANERPWYIWMVAGCLDGVHNSIITQRGVGGSTHQVYAWDFRRNANGTSGTITQRWSYDPQAGQGMGVAHSMQVYDTDNDGKDEIVNIGGVIRPDGTLGYNNKLSHGDHYRVADMDPDHPGAEFFAIQQNNPNLVGMGLYDAATGKPIKEFFMSNIGDLSRGDAGDYDETAKGVEFFSTLGNMYDCKANWVNNNHQFPSWGIWWDADLQREIMTGAGQSATAPVINKWNPNNGNGGDWRLYTIYSEGVHQIYGGWPYCWGDYLGDWREEIILEADDYSELRIYISTIQATNRLYTLMQNPSYRMANITKGRIGASFPDYYLGGDMAPPPPPAFSDAKLVWRGGVSSNLWDTGTTANWATNWYWLTNMAGTTNPPSTTYTAGSTLLFDISGATNSTVLLSGALTPGDIKVHTASNYTFAGTGSLTGTMKLTKVGTGKLTINTTNTFTGATTIWEGPLLVNGALTASPVMVRGGINLDGRLGGNGRVGAGVTAHCGGGVSPGNGVGVAGTLTITNSLVESNAWNNFDLSDDPSGLAKANDQVRVVGSISLSGLNKIIINRINTNLSPGTYTLFTYTGTLAGTVTNLTLEGIPGVPAYLTNVSGAIALVVKNTRAPASVVWKGNAGSVWDLSTSSNWLNCGVSDVFVSGDFVRFDATGAGTPGVNVSAYLPVSGLVVDSASDYVLSGPGTILGSGGLIKTNSGTLSMLSANNYTGPTVIGGGTVEAAIIALAGYPSSLGSAGTDPTNLVFYGGTLRFLADMGNTDRGATLNGGGGTFDIAEGTLVVSGQLTGPGTLTKNGPGTLTLLVSNNYAGGTIINEGCLQLGSFTANDYGLGTGTVTLNGGTLSMIDVENYNHARWNLIVPGNAVAGLNVDGRCSICSSLAGGGTLNIYLPYVRTDFDGDWSAFTGRVVMTGSDFRVGNSFGYARSAWTVNGVYVYPVNSISSVSVGEIAGDANARLSGAAWTVGARNTDATYNGTISGNSVTKVGTGVWTLTGSNYYTGPTTVSAGTLLANNTSGSATGTGAVTVSSGATLGGNGAVSGSVTVNSGGTFSPLGTFIARSTVVLNSGSYALFDLGLANDQLVVNGPLTFNGKVRIRDSGAFYSSTNVLVSYSGSFSSSGLSLDTNTAPPNFTYTLLNTNNQIKLVALATIAAPAAVTTLTALPANSAVNLAWSSSALATTYNVKRSTRSGGPYIVVARLVSTTNYTDTTAVNGTAYYYVVSAVNAGGESADSPQAVAMPPGVPDAPMNVTAIPGNGFVALSWDAANWAMTYNVKRASNSGGPYAVIATNIADGGYYDSMAAGKTNYYVVSAVNLNGAGANSAEVSAAALPLVIAFWTNTITASTQSWETVANWTNVSAYPNASGTIVNLRPNIAAAQTINLSQPIALGVLNVGDTDNSASYILTSSGGGSLTLENGAFPAAITQVSTSKGDTIGAPISIATVLNLTNSSANTMTLSGPVSGDTLGLYGGKFTLLGTNNLSAATVGTNVTLYLGSSDANFYSLSGTVTLNGGIVQLYGYGGDVGTYWGACPANFYIPPNQSGTVRSTPRTGGSGLSGTLTGSGTFNLVLDYVRGMLSGDWSGFNGVINVTPRSGTGDMRILFTTGFSNAILNLASGVYAYHISSLTVSDNGPIAAGGLSGAGSITGGNWTVGARNVDTLFSGNISGSGTTFTKVGTGALTLAGACSYGGLTTLSAGTLQIGNGSTNGVLATNNVVNNGTLIWNRSDSAIWSNNISGTGGLCVMNGTLTLAGSNSFTGPVLITNGTLIVNDSSLPPASGYILSAGVLNASGLTGGALGLGNQTLAGAGSVYGDTLLGDLVVLSPGSNSLGKIAFINTLTMSDTCTTRMKVSPAQHTNDVIQVSGSLTLGGSLEVSTFGASALVAGDSFQLFKAGSFKGTFASITLPELSEGLYWDTSLLVSRGVIQVRNYSKPAMNAALNGEKLVVTATNGLANAPYYVLSSTNLALPLSQWNTVVTNYFDADGSCQFTNLIIRSMPQSFYIIQIP